MASASANCAASGYTQTLYTRALEQERHRESRASAVSQYALAVCRRAAVGPSAEAAAVASAVSRYTLALCRRAAVAPSAEMREAASVVRQAVSGYSMSLCLRVAQ